MKDPQPCRRIPANSTLSYRTSRGRRYTATGEGLRISTPLIRFRALKEAGSRVTELKAQKACSTDDKPYASPRRLRLGQRPPTVSRIFNTPRSAVP